MYLSRFDSGEKVNDVALKIDPTSLYHAYAHVRDGRKDKGKRYPLPLLLKGGLSQAVLHALTERLNGLGDGCQFVVALDICLYVTHLPSNLLPTLLQVLASPFVLI
jgi:hypothetical protein